MSGRMMNYRKYYESLEKMNDPVMPSQLPPTPKRLEKIGELTKEELERL